MKSLSKFPTTEQEKPEQGNAFLLKLMSRPELLTVIDAVSCCHISSITSDQVWVSEGKYLTLTNTTGVPLHRLDDLYDGNHGSHTVNSRGELIYINRNVEVVKLSRDMKTTILLIKNTDYSWKPLCVHCSTSTGDLLVGMYNYVTWTGKVIRYNQSGQLMQTIQQGNTGAVLFIQPRYITENNNEDIVVSDFKSGVVVVTERGGRHRFTYKGPPIVLRLRPVGICTDALSNILVCDFITATIQMLNKDGLFLSYLLRKSQSIGYPISLSYDVSTHRLWVGSKDDNKLCVYRYIIKNDEPTGKSDSLPKIVFIYMDNYDTNSILIISQ